MKPTIFLTLILMSLICKINAQVTCGMDSVKTYHIYPLNGGIINPPDPNFTPNKLPRFKEILLMIG